MVPSVMYATETWNLSWLENISKIQAAETKFLQIVRNEEAIYETSVHVCICI